MAPWERLTRDAKMLGSWGGGVRGSIELTSAPSFPLTQPHLSPRSSPPLPFQRMQASCSAAARQFRFQLARATTSPYIAALQAAGASCSYHHHHHYHYHTSPSSATSASSSSSSSKSHLLRTTQKHTPSRGTSKDRNTQVDRENVTAKATRAEEPEARSPRPVNVKGKGTPAFNGQEGHSPEDDDIPARLLQARREANATLPTLVTAAVPPTARTTSHRPRERVIPLGVKRVAPRKVIVVPLEGYKPPASTPPLPTNHPHRPTTLKRVQRLKPSFRQASTLTALEEWKKGKDKGSMDKSEGLPPLRDLADHSPRPSRHAQKKPRESLQHSRRTNREELLPDRAGPFNLKPAEDAANLRKVLLYARRKPMTPARLSQLMQWHRENIRFANVQTFNMLIELAEELRDYRSISALLQTMANLGVKRNEVTWDTIMTGHARRGGWKQLVDCYEQRLREGTPMTAAGWTRIVQAVTSIGHGSLAEQESPETAGSPSPIFRAVYSMPRGIRELSLKNLVLQDRPDVDRLLASMLPQSMLPLDFRAVVVVSQRLVKQKRWREANEIITNWFARQLGPAELEKLRQTAPSQQQPNGQPAPTSSSSPDEISLHSPLNPEALTAQLRSQCLNTLHILLSGLVIVRAVPTEIDAYLQSHLKRFSYLDVKPTYHTLYLVLTSFRLIPAHQRFGEAKTYFDQFVERYDPPRETPEDEYSYLRAHSLLVDHGLFAARQLKRSSRQRQAQSIIKKLKQIVPDGELVTKQVIAPDGRKSGNSSQEAVRLFTRAAKFRQAVHGTNLRRTGIYTAPKAIRPNR